MENRLEEEIKKKEERRTNIVIRGVKMKAKVGERQYEEKNEKSEGKG